MNINRDDAVNCGSVLKEVVERVSSLDKGLGQTDAQQEAMNSYIDAQLAMKVDGKTVEVIKQVIIDSELPNVARVACTKWLEENLSEKIQDQFDNMMCEKTQATIEEYSLVQHDHLSSAISDEISQNDWSYTIHDAIDYDTVGENVRENIEDGLKETIREDLKEEVEQCVKDTLDSTEDLKKMIRDTILGIFESRFKLGEEEQSEHNVQATRYRLILSEVGLEDNPDSYQKLLDGARKFKSEI